MSEGQTETVVEATPAATSVAVESTTPSAGTTPDGQSAQNTAQGETASEDRFTDIDPKTLPKELQPFYKSMQADYTRKTQASAAARKEAEAVRKEAELLKQLKQDEDFVNYWNGKKNAPAKAEEQPKEDVIPEISDEEFAKAFESKQNFLKFMKEQTDRFGQRTQKEVEGLKAQQRVMKANEIIDNYASQEGNKDLYDLDKYGFITYQLALNPPKSEAEYQTRLQDAHVKARQVYQEIYQKGKDDAAKAFQVKAAASTQMPSASMKGTYSGPDPKKVTVEEAVALARKGIRVPRD